MTDSNNYNKNLIFVLGVGFIIGFVILILLEILLGGALKIK
ncbi:MAG: hypothetical protein AABY79_08565 [Nitrospirota bacterium]|jgi:hypothetical protein